MGERSEARPRRVAPLAVAFGILISQAAEAGRATEPLDPARQYNLGTRQYRRRAFDEAADALSRALAAAKPSLQGRAAYNLGNAHYRQGQADAKTATNEAAALYQQALDNYRTAIQRNPQDRDAQYNYELVAKRLETLKAQQRASDSRSQTADSRPETRDQKQETGSQEQKQQTADSGPPSTSAGAGSTQRTAGEKDGKEKERAAPEEQREAQQGAASQAQAQQRQEASGERPSQNQKALSKQQALWILDNFQREERAAHMSQAQEPARESPVEQDW